MSAAMRKIRDRNWALMARRKEAIYKAMEAAVRDGHTYRTSQELSVRFRLPKETIYRLAGVNR